jgi:GNAT superfamily N-acetyltransferase
VHENNEPTGFLIAYALDKKTYYNWIMGVLPEFREKGYGRKLIELFELSAKQKGYATVQVKTMEKFPSMIHLLTTLKYEEIGFDNQGKIILRKNL